MPNRTVKPISAHLDRQKSHENQQARRQYFRDLNKKAGACLRLLAVAASGLLIFGVAHTSAHAQVIRARIAIASLKPAKLRIDLELPATNILSFRNSYGDALGLAERIEWIQANNPSSGSVLVQKQAPGEFRSTDAITRAGYYVHLNEPARPGHLARVSWLNSDYGLLMLADLLPQSKKEPGKSSSVLIEFALPSNWSVGSNVENQGGQFLTGDPVKAVFLIGPDLRQKNQRIGSTTFSLITAGKWPFSEDDGIKVVRKLLQEYSDITAYELKRKTALMLIPFPGEAGPDRWSAETRGDSVVLLLGNKATRQRALSRLSIVLSHELFHLWVPNSLLLAGDYDWFFEGFTLYQALRTALYLKLISFDSFLDTIARVYESYLASADRDRLSLIEASERRWTNPSSLVYDKGMLVAFMYDLSLRNLSDCRVTSDGLYRQLFGLRTTGQENGNETIIRLLSERQELQSFVADYIEGTRKIDLAAIIAGYGLQVRPDSSVAKLSVGQSLNKEQRKWLKCIRTHGN